MADIEQRFFDSISGWGVRSYSKGGNTFDVVIIRTDPNNIEVELCYKRMKSMVYVDTIRDTAPFFCKNINFLEMTDALASKIPERKMAL